MAIEYPQGDAFLELLIAAMHDAALNGQLTQLQTQFCPQGRTPGPSTMETVRIVVIPDKLKFKWPQYAPAGTPKG